nr:MAG TPA: hypothetical protein [Caudoviricetes sp.]
MDISSNYSLFSDCSSDTIVMRVPSLTLLNMIKSYEGNDKELILLKLQQMRKSEKIKNLIERMM